MMTVCVDVPDVWHAGGLFASTLAIALFAGPASIHTATAYAFVAVLKTKWSSPACRYPRSRCSAGTWKWNSSSVAARVNDVRVHGLVRYTFKLLPVFLTRDVD